MASSLPLNEAHSDGDAAHTGAHNDLAHYVNLSVQNDAQNASGTPARVRLRMAGGQDGLFLQSANDPTIRNLIMAVDYQGAPIFYLADAGGIYLNDNFQLTKGVYGPSEFYADLYGNVKQGGRNSFVWAGAPGNRLDFASACFEQFQSGRLGSIGTWGPVFGSCTLTAVNAFNAFDAAGTPDRLFWQGQMVAASTSTMAIQTSGGTGGIPVVPGDPFSAVANLRAGSTVRSCYAAAAFYTATGAAVSTGGTVNGAAANDAPGAWASYSASGTVPATAAFMALQVNVASAVAGETHYVDGCGVWRGTNTVFNPPQVMQTIGGSAFAGALAGDVYDRTDTPATANQRRYICTAGGLPAAQVWQGIL